MTRDPRSQTALPHSAPDPSEDAEGSLEAAVVQVADLLQDTRYCIALTGAGISAESGIPTYRGKDGLWTKNGEPPLNQYQRFLEDPADYWETQRKRREEPDELFETLREAVPNDGHFALAELERNGVLHHTLTQNIDNLHRLAGSTRLTEIHGNSHFTRCLGCNVRTPFDEIPEAVLPRCEVCGGLLKSDTVMFGEPIPRDVLEACLREADQADCILLVGTTAVVTPAADFAWDIYRRGHPLIEINPEPTVISDHCAVTIRTSAGEALPRVVDRLKRAAASRTDS